MKVEWAVQWEFVKIRNSLFQVPESRIWQSFKGCAAKDVGKEAPGVVYVQLCVVGIKVPQFVCSSFGRTSWLYLYRSSSVCAGRSFSISICALISPSSTFFSCWWGSCSPCMNSSCCFFYATIIPLFLSYLPHPSSSVCPALSECSVTFQDVFAHYHWFLINSVGPCMLWKKRLKNTNYFAFSVEKLHFIADVLKRGTTIAISVF